MGQQDENGKKQHDGHRTPGGADPASSRRPRTGGADGTSGEGAGSALEAMLKKRRQHVQPPVHPAPEPAAPSEPPAGCSKRAHPTGT